MHMIPSTVSLVFHCLQVMRKKHAVSSLLFWLAQAAKTVRVHAGDGQNHFGPWMMCGVVTICPRKLVMYELINDHDHAQSRGLVLSSETN
ncbi:hypothetical protein EV126DRAFT_406292 [Verticillium dahliae]|nr:hypothetical protein EV126DRAFT_406292 [Verticillium dahliae]